nr:zinc finger, CCHC-type [Tanacetum cinerariifolium]
MGEENPIRTLGDYSKPSHEGYRNTLELPEGNNVMPLQSDTIRLVQHRCSFHGLWSEDPNQYLKDFLKLVDSLDLDVANRERTRLRLFQFSLHDQASKWLERLPAGSISTWGDLITRFLAQLFLPGRTVKLRNDILMFQQHQRESLSKAWTRFKDLLQKVPHHGIDHFFKPVKAISTSQSTSKKPDRRLFELEAQIKFLLKESRPTPRSSSTHIPQAYAEAVSSNSHPQNLNEPPKQNPFTFGERIGPYPQPQALGTTFEVQVRDYMTAYTERMKRDEEEKDVNDDATSGDSIERPDESDAKVPSNEVENENEAKNGTKMNQ